MNDQTRLLYAALELTPACGWSRETLERAARIMDLDPLIIDAFFPDGPQDAAIALAAMFDEQTLDQLNNIDIENLRIRDRIRIAVQTRLDIMAPHRDALRCVYANWVRPSGVRALRPLWAAADKIWVWAGDTSTDYNHYTKRTLLSGVMASTTLFWLQDNSPNLSATQAFLNRRIENILKIGQFTGKLISRFQERRTKSA